MKRSSEASTIENPFIKRQNRTWTLSEPPTLSRAVSPPPPSKKPAHKKSSARDGLGDAPATAEHPSDQVKPDTGNESIPQATQHKTATVEAGEVDITDHVSFFSSKLLTSTRPIAPNLPRISHTEWLALYQRNQHPAGHHFVVHQHDHPVAGTHYDLRLQCNETSSISFAIMYGLPGDPNSRRLNRNATETRVHCLWNHLIETASHPTGSMLIWDTGEYTVLPYRETPSQTDTDGEEHATDASSQWASLSEPEKLHRAFQQRKIRLRLHGTRLPRNYTLGIRLTRDNYRAEQPQKPLRRRRKQEPKRPQRTPETSDDEDSDPPATIPGFLSRSKKSLSSLSRGESPPPKSRREPRPTTTAGTATTTNNDPGGSDPESSSEAIRLSNAYPGSRNTISSVHQRKWYLSLDRRSSGFVPGPKSAVFGSRVWVQARTDDDGERAGFDKFHVLGRDVERSVVTGRLARRGAGGRRGDGLCAPGTVERRDGVSLEKVEGSKWISEIGSVGLVECAVGGRTESRNIRTRPNGLKQSGHVIIEYRSPKRENKEAVNQWNLLN